MNKLSIIVPAFNEEEHIKQVVGDLLNTRGRIVQGTGLSEIEIIVVNDGSTDRTGECLDMISRTTNGHLKIVTHEKNSGYGAALKSGFLAATGDLLSFMDADGTVDPESFISMYKSLKENNADMVVGKRFGQAGSQMPMIRKAGNRFFGMLLSFLSGKRVRDTASGMRLFKRGIMPQLYPLPDGLHFTPAMSTKAIHENLKIIEIPVPYSERSGSSKLRVVSDGMRFLHIIVGTVLMYNPFKVFLLVGLVFEIIASALLAVPFYAAFFQKNVNFLDYIYRSIGALYFFIGGVQIILFGILARFMVSTFFRRHESGQVIHKINHALKVIDWMGYYGMGVLLAGVVVNSLYFWKYFFRGGLDMHWAWLLAAAGLIIVGLQMLITGVIMRILKDIKAATSGQ